MISIYIYMKDKNILRRNSLIFILFKIIKLMFNQFQSTSLFFFSIGICVSNNFSATDSFIFEPNFNDYFKAVTALGASITTI